MNLRLPTHRPTRGLTRNEWLWTLLLLIVIVGTIVSTLRAEVERGNQRMAEDTLSFLASQIHLGLEGTSLEGPGELNLPLLGPGLPPKGMTTGSAEPHPLQEIMPEHGYLPVDPWGNGYVLRLGEADGQPTLFIVSGGQAGVLPEKIGADAPLTRRVHWPTQ
ncbi:MAG: hypothetical protein ACYTEP_05740 [Planctomycetota bacterium]|jgi:hypothetical protein